MKKTKAPRNDDQDSNPPQGQIQPPTKRRKKPTATSSAPSWETSRFFVDNSQSKRPSSALPTIQQNGIVTRTPAKRPTFTLKAPVRNPLPTSLKRNDKSSMKSDERKKSAVNNTKTPLERSKSFSRIPSHSQTSSSPTETQKKQLQKSKSRNDIGRQNQNKKSSSISAATIQKVKTQLASLASTIISDPSKHYGKLSDLRQISVQYKGKLCALSLLTESQVFRDIAPGYPIRPLTDKEASVKVSKQVASVRSFEQGLLNSYKRFTKSCVSHSQFRSAGNCATQSAKDMIDVKIAASKAICSLIVSLPHFNDADTVLAPAVVLLAGDKMSEVRSIAKDAMCTLMSEVHKVTGQQLETCVGLAKGLAKSADSGRRARVVSEETIAPLSEINFAAFSRLPGAQKKVDYRKGKRMSKRKREMEDLKNRKQQTGKEDLVDDDELEKDMAEADADATPQELLNARKALLDAVCTACFNVIREASEDCMVSSNAEDENRTSTKTRNKKPPPALSAALRGLLRVARYVSPEVIDSIIVALIPMLRNGGKRYSVSLRFRCVTVAYEICSMRKFSSKISKKDAEEGEGESFETDACALDAALYAMLNCVIEGATEGGGGSNDDESLMFDAVEAIYSATNGGKRRLPNARAAALARRLSMLACTRGVTHACAIGYLKSAQTLLDSSLLPKSLFFGNNSGKDSGSGGHSEAWEGEEHRYDMKCENAELSNGARSVAWEFACLHHHFHPVVRAIVDECVNGICGDGLPKRTDNAVVFAKQFVSSEGGFNPLPQDRFQGQVTKKSKAQKRKWNFMEDEAVKMVVADEGMRKEFVKFGATVIDDMEDDDDGECGHYFKSMFKDCSNECV